MINNLVDETMTEITPYKEAVVKLYKEQRSNKDSITVTVDDEYTAKLKVQLEEFKEVLSDNVKKAEEEKAKLEKTLDQMDAEFYTKLGENGKFYKIHQLEKLIEAKEEELEKTEDAELKASLTEEIKKATEELEILNNTPDTNNEMSSPEELDSLINDVFNQGYEETHKVYLIDQFISTKQSEIKAIDDMIKEIDSKSETLVKAIISSKLVVNMLYDITKDESMVALWKDDFAKIQEKSKEEESENWVTILKYCSMTKAKKEILELQKMMNETVQKLFATYKEYVDDEEAKKIESIPEINWYGGNRDARYKAFDTVVQHMRDSLHRVYLENQANLSNEKLKEIKNLIFNTDYLCLSKELRDSRLIEAFTIPDPVSRYSYRVNMLSKPIMEGLYSKYIDNAYEFALYTMSIIREPNAFWLVFLLAGEM